MTGASPLPPTTVPVERRTAATAVRVSARELGVTALEYLTLVLLATAPALTSLSSAALGDPYSDMWKHLWGLWWFRDAIVHHHAIPLFTTGINYPQGGYLYFADPLTALVSIPLQPLLGLVATYNVLMMAQVLGGCLGAYLLARELGLERTAAFLSGVVFGLSPYVLSYSVASGVTETVNLAWPPLYLLYLRRSLLGDGLGAQVRAGVALFLTAFSCWYYSEFMLLMTAFCVLFGEGSAPLGSGRKRAMADLVARGRRVIPILVVGFCLILPFAAAFAQTLKNPYNLVTPDKHGLPNAPPVERNAGTTGDYLGENQLNFTGLVDFVLPGKENATTTLSMDRLTRSYYLGWLAGALVLVGLGLTPRPWSRTIHFWLWGTAAFALLSLGPVIHLRSSSLDGTSLGTSWPYWIMFYGFPLFKQVGQPFRLMLLVYLGFGLLVGFGLQQVLTRFPRLRPVAWLITMGVLAETLYASPALYPMPMSPARIPPVYRTIAETAGDDAVWDVPEERPGSLLQPSEYYWYQTFHGHPIPYRTSGQVSPQIRNNPVHAMLVQMLYGGVSAEEASALIRTGLDELREMKIRWFVIHRKIIGPRRAHDLRTYMSAALGAPFYEDEDVIAFRLY